MKFHRKILEYKITYNTYGKFLQFGYKLTEGHKRYQRVLKNVDKPK